MTKIITCSALRYRTQAELKALFRTLQIELVYAARVSLDRTSVDVDGRDVPRPRTAVTVEITTGAHRVITYLLSPLLRSTRIAYTSVELV